MAKLVGAFAASHGPLLVRAWDTIPAERKDRLARAFQDLGRRLAAADPDVLVVIAPDHWANFSLDHIPSVCIGVGAENEGPPEPWMKAFPHQALPGHPEFAAHLVQTALDAGFEPSISHRPRMIPRAGKSSHVARRRISTSWRYGSQ